MDRQTGRGANAIGGPKGEFLDTHYMLYVSTGSIERGPGCGKSINFAGQGVPLMEKTLLYHVVCFFRRYVQSFLVKINFKNSKVRIAKKFIVVTTRSAD